MALTYTSASLSKIADSIPDRAIQSGLVIVSGVEIEKEIDVQVDSEKADVVVALQIAALVNAPFISVEASHFSVGMLRAAREYTDLPAAAERLLKLAEERNGSLMSVTLSWVAEGLSYQWMAQSDWIGPLLSGIDRAVEDAAVAADAEHEKSMEEYRTAFRVAVSALVASPKFRGSPIGKRSLVAPLVLAEAGVEELPTVIMRHQVLPEANKIVKANAYEYEQDFSSRVADLAKELREYPEWTGGRTKGKRTAAAINFLAEKADGYRLHTQLAEEISEAAGQGLSRSMN